MKRSIPGEFEMNGWNVRSEWQSWDLEKIRAQLDLKRLPFSTAVLNLEYGSNVGAMIRTHNAFCGRAFYYIGRRKFNRKPCVGTYLYEKIIFFPTVSDFISNIPSDSFLIGVENHPWAIPLPEFDWPGNPIIVFGNENSGFDEHPELLNACRYVVKIPQRGSVRSLNVSVSAGIVLYDLMTKKGWWER